MAIGDDQGGGVGGGNDASSTTPEARRNLLANTATGQTPLIAAHNNSSSPSIIAPHDDLPADTTRSSPGRRRRINLTNFLLKQADKTSPLIKEHLVTFIEYSSRASRNWICWIATAIITLLMIQGIILQFSADSETVRIKRRKGSSVIANQLELEDDLDNAYRQWKILQEASPNKFGNFSKFLIESKHKESRLRKRLSALSEESLNRFRNIVVPPAGEKPLYNADEEYELMWSYLMPEKSWPYVGSERYLERYKNDSRLYYNSLAVFPHNNKTRLHGLVGIWPNGTRAWVPKPIPPPIKQSPIGAEAELKDGGFYLKLSNALPLDRDVPDQRQDFCSKEVYNLEEYDDASVVIVFYNEHLSTLLRSVHSVLNSTPPPLLREIILVDDHSNATDVAAGGGLDEYIKLLPKTKILRLPERRGIVQGRLAGAKIARAPIFVMLDSHIEVGPQWLEPMTRRLKESPKSVVFPQIFAIDAETFEHRKDSGIGCFLSFKWMMQERPYFNASASAEPVASPSLAGGLFAVRRDWFFDIGGYDEEFKMWGAENVEMGFRYWQCGGRVDCMPCSLTYHIYRHGGSGYKSPGAYIIKNRRRTAMLWLDRYYQIAKQFMDEGDEEESAGVDLGSFEKMKALKKRFQCKSFDWFLKHVDPGRASGAKPQDYGLMGDIKSKALTRTDCIDSLQQKEGGKPYGLYTCHGSKGSQGWFEVRSNHQLRNMGTENICLASDLTLSHCDRFDQDARWLVLPDFNWIAFANSKSDLDFIDQLIQEKIAKSDFDQVYENLGSLLQPDEWKSRVRCLAVEDQKILLKECQQNDPKILWRFKLFHWDENYKGPQEMLMPDYDPAQHDNDDDHSDDGNNENPELKNPELNRKDSNSRNPNEQDAPWPLTPS